MLTEAGEAEGLTEATGKCIFRWIGNDRCRLWRVRCLHIIEHIHDTKYAAR